MSRAVGLWSVLGDGPGALKGMGVALGHSLLVAPYLERATLVALFEPPVAAPARYFLAVAPGCAEKPGAREFLDWLRVETRRIDAAGRLVVEQAPRGEGWVLGRGGAARTVCTGVR